MRAGTEVPVGPVESATMRGKIGLYAGAVGGIVALDLVTKLVVQALMTPYRPMPVLGDVFRLTYIYNPGAAFGLNLGGQSRLIFGALAVIAVVLLFLFYRATPVTDRVRLVAIASVTGGAIGNLIDRFRSPRGVVDFLDVGVGTVRWPVFNVADIAVTCGAILLAISLWKEDTRGDDRDAGG